MSAAKPFNIPKELVAAAFLAVKDSAGGAGIDKETIGQFESKLKDNLYKIWNRMPSGSFCAQVARSAIAQLKSPAAGQGGSHSEEEWRGKAAWRAHGVGSRGSDGGQDDA